jgi:SAM-dependent methyltransferase
LRSENQKIEQNASTHKPETSNARLPVNLRKGRIHSGVAGVCRKTIISHMAQMEASALREEMERNRIAWNEAMEYHQKAKGRTLAEGFADCSFTVFNRPVDMLVLRKLKSIGLEGKVIAQLPCNNGRELISLMRLGAAGGFGFDISDKAIDEAKELAKVAGVEAEFERINVLDIGNEHNEKLDFIFISEGSLQWFPDLADYFSVISRLLKKDGIAFICEMHPFSYFFEQLDENGCDDPLSLDGLTSYFEKGPYSYMHGLDYAGGVKYDAKQCYWYLHKLSDIINALAGNGLEIVEMIELNDEVANNASVSAIKKFPLSYMMTCRKR